jgi:hypothetical protein
MHIRDLPTSIVSMELFLNNDDNNNNLLFARALGNITGSTGFQPGFINASHTSDVTAGWTPSTLAMPFPLVLVSSLVSFVLACIGWKTAMTSIPARPEEEQVRIRRPEGWDNMTWGQRWKWSQRATYRPTYPPPEIENPQVEHVALQPVHSIQQTKGYTQLPPEQEYTLPEPRQDLVPILRWQDSLPNKIVVLVSTGYNTIRSMFALITTIHITHTRVGTHSAISSLFLLFLSLQTFISNRKLPRLLTLILVLDLIAVGIAFLITSWDFHTASYGEALVLRGNCPVYAPNCRSQAQHWTKVGCGAVLPPYTGGDKYAGDNPSGGAAFYPPYGGQGNLNMQKGQNTLRVMEAIVGGIGTFWVGISLLATMYEAVRVFVTIESLRHLLWPLPSDKKISTNKKTGKARTRLGWNAMNALAFFALGGAFIVTILSIAGHAAVETHHYTATYIDSFGPAVNTNVTHTSRSSGFVTVNSTQYWGNESSWSDCFTVSTPTSSNGFFKDWMENNAEQIVLRLISLL